MEDYEEKIFDEIRTRLIERGETISAISKGSGVAYYAIVNILKGNKEKAYRAETFGKLKEYISKE